MSKQTLQNIAVVSVAFTAAVAVIYANTTWLSASPTMQAESERCYGIVKAHKNDCANAKHSCATQATKDGDPDEWISVPKGLCERIAGGKVG
jgi:uncharacterized membrane protein